MESDRKFIQVYRKGNKIMKNRNVYYMTAVVLTSSMLALTACGSKQEEPVTSESVESMEEPEEVQEPEEEVKESEEREPEDKEDTEKEEPRDNQESEPDTGKEEIPEEDNSSDLGYEIIPMDETLYYATTDCNVRSGPGTAYDVVNGLSYAQEITVNGKVETADSVWYVIKTDGDTQMVSGSLLSTTKPAPRQSTQPSGGGSQAQQPSGGNNGGDGSQAQQPAPDNGGGSTSGGLEVDGGGEAMVDGDWSGFDWGADTEFNGGLF